MVKAKVSDAKPKVSEPTPVTRVRLKKIKIDGYTYTQFKKLMSESKRPSVYNHKVMPSWGSDELKEKTIDEWVQWAIDNYEEDMKVPSIAERRAWTPQEKKEFVDKLSAQPVKKV